MTQRKDPPADVMAAVGAPAEWDAVIVGDGSGSRYGHPGGWSAVLFDRASGLRKLLHGGVSDTTVNVMELTPYVYAMGWYAAGPGKERLFEVRRSAPAGVAPRPLSVHVLTDCEVLVKQGNGLYDRRANAAMWATMDAFARQGYSLTWHYAARSTTAANRLCDAVSKASRLAIALTAPPASPYDDEFGS